MRPDTVAFGEDIHHYDEAAEEIRTAGKVLVVGTSLSVFPAAKLVKLARYQAEKILVDLETKKPAYGFRVIRGSAEKVLPSLAERC